MDQSSADSPISALYVHVPFCRGKCDYCAFFSVAGFGEVVDRTLNALAIEADLLAAPWPNRRVPVETIFIGGGTPTSLSIDALSRLLTTIDAHIDRIGDVEFTCETSPETTSADALATLVAHGVNRISLGVQSFDDGLLRAIGRRHRSADIAKSVAAIRRAGVKRLSLDLIYGLPGQTPAMWRRDLERAIELSPQHISCYELTIEPGTKLADLVRTDADDDAIAAMYHLAADVLCANGFEHYEISNYARCDERCRHNERYWRNRSYVGLGPSAAGYIDGTRYTNVAEIDAYCDALIQRRERPIASSEHLVGDALAGETAMLNLRTSDGIDVNEFRKTTGIDPTKHFAEAIEKHRREGLLAVDARSIRLTQTGMAVANEVLAEFLA